MASKLIIVCGLPGSGKTTHSRKLESELTAIRMCPDEWMSSLDLDLRDGGARSNVEFLQWELTQRLLQTGTSVIIEWGTWSQSEREALRVRGQELGATVELHFLNPPVELLFERIRRRNRESPPIEPSDLSEWSELFEPPTSTEMAQYDRWWMSDGVSTRTADRPA